MTNGHLSIRGWPDSLDTLCRGDFGFAAGLEVAHARFAGLDVADCQYVHQVLILLRSTRYNFEFTHG